MLGARTFKFKEKDGESSGRAFEAVLWSFVVPIVVGSLSICSAVMRRRRRGLSSFDLIVLGQT
jgi:hypothetical protein